MERLKTEMTRNLFGASLPQHRAYPTSATHNFYLYGPIRELPEYVDMITVLDTAQEADQIHIYINTPGGELNATISIIHAMLRSRAQVVTHADGEVASAGTLIFFAASLRVVYPYSHFMFHDAGGGSVGKMNENLKNIIASSQLVERIAYDMYCPTFSEEEVDHILEGRDYYCDAEEMYDRIKAVEDMGTEEQEQDDVQGEEIEEEETDVAEDIDLTGELVVIDNPKLKSHGEEGIVAEDNGGETVKVLLNNGKTIHVKIYNLKEVD